MSNGFCFVAYGARALNELHEAYVALRQFTTLPVMALTEQQVSGIQTTIFKSETSGRWAKLNLDLISPFDNTLYMDVDTRIKDGAILTIFDILDDGFDIVIAPSGNQHDKVFSHIGENERQTTFTALQNPMPLQLQAGVFGFRKSEEVHRMFEHWRQEWQVGEGQDQAALLRALDQQPLKLWILSLDWNSLHGEIVEHLFGRARN